MSMYMISLRYMYTAWNAFMVLATVFIQDTVYF